MLERLSLHGFTASARRFALPLMAALLIALLLAGCGGGASTDADADSDSGDDAPAEETAAKPAPLRIGTLTTEDALPLWVAEAEATDSDGVDFLGDAGLTDFEIVTFQAAQERDAALAAGEIDAFMGDLLAAANFESGGVPVTVATVMLGATAEEGRFGIVAAPGSDVTELTQLAGVPVGTSSATIQEYILDGLMRQAGVSADQVTKEEVKKVPVRFELVMKGQLKAAALPEPFLSLAEVQGATLVADDTTGENISQTVLVFSDEYLEEEGGTEAMEAVLQVWDEAAALVNEDPDSWRDLLVEKARLPEPIADTYEISTYPESQLPTREQIDAVLEWMDAKGLLKEPVTYDDLVQSASES